jgi:hypothetical protein
MELSVWIAKVKKKSKKRKHYIRNNLDSAIFDIYSAIFDIY